jgi:REP element-mobilizing transposase RayT
MSATYTNLLFHIVFSTKHRARSLHRQIESDLYAYIGGIIRNRRGILLEIGGTEDHVHLATRLRADSSVADVVRDIKSVSSGWCNQRPDVHQSFAWQTGYAAFSVSESQVSVLRRYIRRQKEHHRNASFKEELISLLRKHNVDFDERYIFE